MRATRPSSRRALEANLAPSGHVTLVGLFAVFVGAPLPEGPRGPEGGANLTPAFGRVVMLNAVMLVTALADLWSMGPIAPMPERTGTFDGVSALAPVVTFSLVLHHSVPQIVAPVKVRSRFDKSVLFRRAL